MATPDPTPTLPADPGCDPLDVSCATAGWQVDGGSTALDELASAVMEALDTTLGALGTMWVDVATPSLTGDGEGAIEAGEVAPESVAAVETVLGYVVWVSLGVAVLSIVALGAWMALAGRRGDGERHLGRLGVVLGGVILISAASGLVAALVPAERFASTGSAPVATTQNALWWFTAAMAVLAVIVAGAKMAWEQRAAAGRDLVRSLLTLVVVAGAGLTVIALAVVAADSFALWLLERVTGGADFGAQVTAMLTFSDTMGVLLIIVLGLIAVVAAFVQIMLLVLRGAMLVILAGIFPLSASFTNTAVGRSWFYRVIAWIVAFVLYKPAAAIVYATAFQLTEQNLFADDGTGLVPVLAGIILMVLALMALPALMSVVAPLVGTVAPSATPAATTLPPGTSAAMPTGAVSVHRLRPAAGPSGAVGLPGSSAVLAPAGGQDGGRHAGPGGALEGGPSGRDGPATPPGAADALDESRGSRAGETAPRETEEHESAEPEGPAETGPADPGPAHLSTEGDGSRAGHR